MLSICHILNKENLVNCYNDIPCYCGCLRYLDILFYNSDSPDFDFQSTQPESIVLKA